MSRINSSIQWELKRLGDVCEMNPSKAEISQLPGDIEVTFLPMAAVSDEGFIVKPETRHLSNVRNGFSYFRENDVLFAKITPCMENGKGAIANNLVNGIGFGSTEFHVLRANQQQVLPEWIYFLLRQRSLREEARSHMTGTAGQKRVPKQFLETTMIPVPPIKTQKKLTSILGKAYKLKQKREQANQMTNKILRAIFLKMFGDPEINPKRWVTDNFGNLIVDMRYGTSVKCISEDKGIPVLRIPNIIHGKIEISDLKFAELAKNELEKLSLLEGDLLFVRTNGNREYVGRSAVFHEIDRTYAFASYLIRARLDKKELDPKFANTYLSLPSIRMQLYQHARTSAGQYNINTKGLRAIRFIVPPMKLQREFATITQKIETIMKRQYQSTQEITQLFNSLMSKAFKGELVHDISEIEKLQQTSIKSPTLNDYMKS